ncbi:MAG: hypothetical protein WC827_04825 [Candidatus Paceibacterota bacterium]|jgi:hypothetical protein
MRMSQDEKYIVSLATNIIGKNLLATLLEKREKKVVRREVVRQVFTHCVKVAVSKMSLATLGEICAYGDKLGIDGFLVTSGRNSGSAIFLDTADSGRVLVQKIAVATILSAIDKLINEGKSNLSEFWTRHDLVCNAFLNEHLEVQQLKKTMGW